MRVLRADDVTSLYVDWLNDPEVNRYLESRFVEHALEEVCGFVESVYESDTDIIWGAFLNGGTHIGNIKIGPTNFHHKRSHIGLMIGDKNSWGQGYASELIDATSRFSFASLGIHRLEAGCYEQNIGSQKAFLKVGYQLEGTQRQAVISDGTTYDAVILGLLSHELD